MIVRDKKNVRGIQEEEEEEEGYEEPEEEENWLMDLKKKE